VFSGWVWPAMKKKWAASSVVFFFFFFSGFVFLAIYR
jgi:hypothetical protein